MPYCTVCGAKVSGNFCAKCGKAVTPLEDGPVRKEYTSQQGYQNDYYDAYKSNPYTQQSYAQNWYAQNYAYPPVGGRKPISGKCRLTAFLLCVFLGCFGAHHFYSGRVGYGIVYLFTFGLFGIGYLVDLILIATGSYKDKYGFYLENWNT